MELNYMKNIEVENKGIDDGLFNKLVAVFEKSPSLNTLGITLLYLGHGTVGMRMTARQEYTTVMRRLHGGLIATLADTAMGWAVLSLGRPCVTVDMTLNYFAPVFETTELTAKGYVIHDGKNTVITEAELFVNNEKLVAKSRGTFFVNPQADMFEAY